jgi:Cu(I)/Ag(I) efflux system membrane fusion protein
VFWFISPVLNEETRTVKVLLNINNTERKLKPGMFVSAVIRAELRSDGKPAPTGVEGQWSCPDASARGADAGRRCPVCKMKLVQIPGTPASAKPEGDQCSSPCP